MKFLPAVRRIAADWLIRRRARASQDFFFIEVGANDGKTGDPIHGYIERYGWRGILVEPVPYLFEKLLRTYDGRPGLIFENVAIDSQDGQRTFYRVERNDEPGNPFWYDQLGSFNKEVVLKHRGIVPNLEAHLVTEEVPCLSFEKLLDKHSVQRVDLLHIDTEGYDYEIVKAMPLAKIKPDMILYEHQHLSDNDRRDCLALLRRFGYKVLELDRDAFAYRP